ncbi:YfgM family protein [Ostreibacterium oceani]|uniref:Ancillary SecYEG translocon subunit n=1 Tax=Ostreibacterium oceani TaxID=2654998 RepID=A0A6N7EWR4_9GAMM|nr:tetratricopeptide repeat protein [Ostreibacterium oceani]MPV85859.1 tetratricopeptide repeat protein [Ostreibacterium oceani]
MDKIEIDRTEQEREELVKQFIKDYWLVAVLAVGGAIGLVYGLEYYKKRQFLTYNDAAMNLSAVEAALTDNATETALNSVTAMQQQNDQAKTGFATVATLSLAKHYFDSKDYKAALAQYDWLIANAPDAAYQQMASIRKARVLAEMGEVTQAVEALSRVESTNFMDEANLLKGDIYLADAQFEQAISAYESISDLINPQLVQQRLDIVNIKKAQADTQ